MSRLICAWTLVLVLLAVPATALAQSAGDDQYSDPLAEQPTTQDQQPQQGSDGGSSTPAPAPTQSAPAESTQSGSTVDSTTTTGDDALPRTGLDIVLLLAAAAPLLLGGFALRRVARDA